AIAHELNQPLAAMSAYSEVALHAIFNDGLQSGQLKRALEGCVEQAQRAGRSLHELLAFLQKSELVTERLNLNELIHDVLNIVCNDGHGGFHVTLHLQQDIPAVQCNRTQVQKVLVNLFRNAEEAMRAIGVLILTITTKVQTMNETSMALIVVQDSGPGLDQVMAKRLFEPFATTKPTRIGMGLAISRALIEANDGHLWLDPEANSGAKFHFTLPLAP
ncbi:sensor histidine kinase, partial [Nitrosomonas supralitoralis]